MEIYYRSSHDDDWNKDPEAVLVSGGYGQPHMEGFPGYGPTPAEMQFKALLIDGIAYQPDRRQERPPHAQRHTRRWVPIRPQPHPRHIWKQIDGKRTRTIETE